MGWFVLLLLVISWQILSSFWTWSYCWLGRSILVTFEFCKMWWNIIFILSFILQVFVEYQIVVPIVQNCKPILCFKLEVTFSFLSIPLLILVLSLNCRYHTLIVEIYSCLTHQSYEWEGNNTTTQSYKCFSWIKLVMVLLALWILGNS